MAQDVDWHPTQENLLASVGDDKMLMMFVSHLYSPVEHTQLVLAGIQEPRLNLSTSCKLMTERS